MKYCSLYVCKQDLKGIFTRDIPYGWMVQQLFGLCNKRLEFETDANEVWQTWCMRGFKVLLGIDESYKELCALGHTCFIEGIFVVFSDKALATHVLTFIITT